jgi:hypothetical protein
MARLENEPCVAGRVELLPGDGHTEFTWHVETRCGRRLPVHLHAREIVNGIPAALNKCKYPVQTPFAAWNAKGGQRLKAELRESNDVGQVLTTEAVVVRNVQEDGVGLDWRERHWLTDLKIYLLGLATVAFSFPVPDPPRRCRTPTRPEVASRSISRRSAS